CQWQPQKTQSADMQEIAAGNTIAKNLPGSGDSQHVTYPGTEVLSRDSGQPPISSSASSAGILPCNLLRSQSPRRAPQSTETRPPSLRENSRFLPEESGYNCPRCPCHSPGPDPVEQHLRRSVKHAFARALAGSGVPAGNLRIGAGLGLRR